MDIGLIGLGKMGGNMRTRIRKAGHTVVGYDTNAEISDSASLEDMVSQLTGSPKVVWIMVPVQFIDNVLDDLVPHLSEGDIVIDGGNTKWDGDQPRADRLAEKGIHFIDCGVSGGVWGLENGYALMCGGDEADVAAVMPIFEALKPEGEFGFVHAGDHGAGHFAKMVHNGMEYAIMQAYAEGWELMEKVDIVKNVPGDVQVLARGHGHPLLAAGPDRPGAGRRSRPVRDPRLRRGLRRGPLDGGRGDRQRGPGAGADRGAVRPVRVPAERVAGDEDGRGDAQPVRRSRGADRQPVARRDLSGRGTQVSWRGVSADPVGNRRRMAP